MKKFSSKLILILSVLMISSTLFAGSMDYLVNQSAKFIMTFSRNGAADSAADLANYNPAGTAFFKPGLYLDVSSQTLIKPYSQDVNIDFGATANTYGVTDKDDTYEQNEATPVLPNFYAVYNFGQVGMGNLAISFQAGIVAGGGTVDWKDGNASSNILLGSLSVKTVSLSGGGHIPGDVTSQSFEATSIYYGIGVGAAYSFNNMVSVSLGERTVIATRSIHIKGTYTIGDTIDGQYDYNAVGITPIIGVDVKPLKELNITVRYEHETNLKFEYEEKKLDVSNSFLATATSGMLGNLHITDGQKFNYNLPSILAFGADYAVTPEWIITASGNIYFMHQNNLGKAYDATKTAGTAGNEVCDVNKYFGTGWEVMLGTTYKVIPALKVGIGFMYTESGAKDSYFENSFTLLHAAANPPLDSITGGLGATYAVENTGVDVTLAASWTHYLPLSYSFDPTVASPLSQANKISGKYEKDIYNIALGVGYAL